MKNYIQNDLEMMEVANTVIGEVEEEIKKMLSYLWVCDREIEENMRYID